MSIKKEVYSGKKVSFFYDLDGKLIAEKDLSNGNWTDYIYNGLEPVAQIKNQPPWVSIGNFLRADKTGGKVHLDWTLYGGSENSRIYRSINDFTFSNPSVIQELTAKTFDDDVLYDGNNYAYKIYKNVPTEVIYYYHTDHLMTPLYLTDESQSIVWQAEYYPFGRIYSQTGEVSNNLRFPGQYAEEILNNSFLYYNWHRWYSYKLGRYLSIEQVEYSKNNKNIYEREYYEYSHLNPIVFYDFKGLKPLNCQEIFNYIEKCNKSKKFSKEFIACLIWKESSFNPDFRNPKSTATGLMQITERASKDVGYDHKKMKDPCINIEAGTTYLDKSVNYAKGNIENGVNKYYYGKGSNYYRSIENCEKCLKNESDKCCKAANKCFKGIHK